MDYRNNAVLTYDDAERILAEVSIENVQELEEILCKEISENGFKPLEAKTAEWDAVLAKHPSALRGADPRAVTEFFVERILMGDFSFTSLVRPKELAREETFRRHKDRLVVKRALEAGESEEDVQWLTQTLDEIDRLLAEGKTYENIFETVIHCDVGSENDAFLCHVTESTGQEITSGADLVKYANLRAELGADAHECVMEAQHSRYTSFVRRQLKQGAKYNDLCQIDPVAFGLPSDGWELEGYRHTREDELLRAIYWHFGLCEPRPDRAFGLRDIADILEAPYSVILKASSFAEGLE